MPNPLPLTADDFEPCKGETFQLTTAKGVLALELVDARSARLRDGGASPSLQSAPAILPQATLSPRSPTLELFIVPSARKNGRISTRDIYVRCHPPYLYMRRSCRAPSPQREGSSEAQRRRTQGWCS